MPVIIATHFSTRYHSRQIQTLVERALPTLLDGRMQIWQQADVCGGLLPPVCIRV